MSSSSSAAKKRASEDDGGANEGKKAKAGGKTGIPTPSWFQPQRVRTLTSSTAMKEGGACVLYWMARDQRAEDNWALLLARHLASVHNVPLAVCFNLTPPVANDPLATLRAYGWMLRGLQETDAALAAKHIPLYLLQGLAPTTVPALCAELKAAAVVTDFSPLREAVAASNGVAQALAGTGVPLLQVDAHNVVPVWEASGKQEVGARTIRKKIHDKFPDFFVAYPEGGLAANDPAAAKTLLPSRSPNDWMGVLGKLQIDRSVPEVDWLVPGARAGWAAVEDFIEGGRLKVFADKRNDPCVEAISNLSPYFNFGQLSVQAVMRKVKAVKRHHDSVAAFVEEGIVRRELSDNYVLYQPKYDSLEGAAGWAQESLRLHASDPRQFVYTRQQLEEGKTHDQLWNASQLQLVQEGKLHGFLRMYWAKKILEWTAGPEEALAIGLYLNDRFALDGRDPNGFVGVGWSVMGVHDMGWTERRIFGKIRFMNYDGCRRKFDVDGFCRRYPQSITNAKAVIAAKGAGNGAGPVIVGKGGGGGGDEKKGASSSSSSSSKKKAKK